MVSDAAGLSGLIRSRCRVGASMEMIAREFGVSKSTVRRHVPEGERRDAAAAAQQRHRNRARQADAEVLRALVLRLYRAGMPQRRVAARLGISVEAVRARIDASQRRSPREAARLAGEQGRVHLPEGEIIARYVNGATVEDLGRLYGVYPSTIRHRIPDCLSRTGGSTLRGRGRRALPDEEIRRRYRAGESFSGLAREFGVSPSTIRARIPAAERRQPGPNAEAPSSRPAPIPELRTVSARKTLPIPDEEILARYRAGESATALAREAGVSCPTILRRIPAAEHRGHRQAQQLNRPAPHVTEDTIRALRSRGWPWEAIAVEVGLSVKTVRARA